MDIREKTGYKLERRLKGRLKLGCEEALYALLGVVGVLKCRPPSLVLHRVHVPAMTSSQGFVFQAPWRLMYALIGHREAGSDLPKMAPRGSILGTQ